MGYIILAGAAIYLILQIIGVIWIGGEALINKVKQKINSEQSSNSPTTSRRSSTNTTTRRNISRTSSSSMSSYPASSTSSSRRTGTSRPSYSPSLDPPPRGRPIYEDRPPRSSRPNSTTYRPSKTKTSTIRFNNGSAGSTSSSTPLQDIQNLHDAFTGAPLDRSKGLYQCKHCKVYYHTNSFKLLEDQNLGRCVSCQSRSISVITVGMRPRRGLEYKPGVITLENYREKEGSVVTFEGYVYDVYESRRGDDFAVMFEDKSWTRGFKMVVFSDDVPSVGGRDYIKNLKNKTIRIRGLIHYHQTFGYEMIVSEGEMILGVEDEMETDPEQIPF